MFSSPTRLEEGCSWMCMQLLLFNPPPKHFIMKLTAPISEEEIFSLGPLVVIWRWLRPMHWFSWRNEFIRVRSSATLHRIFFFLRYCYIFSSKLLPVHWGHFWNLYTLTGRETTINQQKKDSEHFPDLNLQMSATAGVMIYTKWMMRNINAMLTKAGS